MIPLQVLLDKYEKDEVDDEYFFSRLQHELDEIQDEEIEDMNTDNIAHIEDVEDAIGRKYGEDFEDEVGGSVSSIFPGEELFLASTNNAEDEQVLLTLPKQEDEVGVDDDEGAIGSEQYREVVDKAEEGAQHVADAAVDLSHEQSQQLQTVVTDVSFICQVCHWSFNEKCFCPNFTPNRCEYAACNNSAHLRCLVMWVKENQKEDYINNYENHSMTTFE